MDPLTIILPMYYNIKPKSFINYRKINKIKAGINDNDQNFDKTGTTTVKLKNIPGHNKHSKSITLKSYIE